MTRRPTLTGMRPLMGNVTYVRDDHALDDPELEKKRLQMVALWRRGQIKAKAVRHIRRIANEHGLAQSVTQLFDRNGLPPQNVSLASMMRQYRQLKKQQGWLMAINEELRSRLKRLDLVRYHSERADALRRLRERREERAELYRDAASSASGNADSVQLPPKLAAAIREAIELEIKPKEKLVSERVQAPELTDILGSRQVQKMMKHVFSEYLPIGDKTVPANITVQFSYLAAALREAEWLEATTRMNLYDLQEFIESADLLASSRT